MLPSCAPAAAHVPSVASGWGLRVLQTQRSCASSKLLETSFSPGLGLKYYLPSFCVCFLPLGQVVNLLRMGAVCVAPYLVAVSRFLGSPAGCWVHSRW